MTTLKTLGLAAALAMGSCQIDAAQSAPILPGPYLSGEIGVESGSGAAIYAITTISRTLDSSSAHAASHADYEGFLSPVPSIRAFASDFTSAAPIEDYSAFAKSDFTLSYYLEVMGPGAGTVPVEVTADGRAVGNATASFDVECSGCALGATVKSPPLNAWLLHTEFPATSGELYEIDLIADADPPSGDYKGTIFMASAEVDPYFQIDPSFAARAQYSLVFSPGISDIAPGGVPELPTWMMLLLGFIGIGLAGLGSRASHGGNLMRQTDRHLALGLLALTTGIAVICGEAGQHDARAQGIAGVDARIVALNIPGASAIAEVGAFLNVPPPGACANPIPSKFPTYIQPGAVLDPKRILVGSRSNFGAPLASGGGKEGSFLSIDPSGPGVLRVPANFAQSGGQASTLGGAVQMFSANSPGWINSVNNPSANTASYAGVGNPLGLSNNNAFGRVWPANAPFGDDGIGSSSILDPTGLPLAGPPNKLIGGVYAGDLTDRDVVATPPQAQVIPGSLSTGAVGTALLGPSPDGSCKAVFAVVTADGAVVQEDTLKGLDGLAAAGTVRPLLGRSWGDALNEGYFRKVVDSSDEDVEPRLGVIMNPYTTAPVVRQLFVSEPFQNTIAVLSLVNFGVAPNQVFGLSTINRIGSPWLNLPVDLAPVQRDNDDVNWASNTTLDRGSDFYVANRGSNTIVRMRQDGAVVAARRIHVGDNSRLDDEGLSLNGIATSSDGKTIYVTFTGARSQRSGSVLALPAF